MAALGFLAVASLIAGAFFAASMARYEPIDRQLVWDRWLHRRCEIQTGPNDQYLTVCSREDQESLNSRLAAQHAAEALLQDRINGIASKALREEYGPSVGAVIVSRLQAAKISDGTIAEFVTKERAKFRTAGASDDEINLFFAGSPYGQPLVFTKPGIKDDLLQKLSSILQSLPADKKNDGSELLKQLRIAGANEQDISTIINHARFAMMDSGYTKSEIDNYFGLPQSK